MRRETNATESGSSVTLPADWAGEVEIARLTDDSFVVSRVDEESGATPPVLPTADRPVLVHSHYGRSAITPSSIDAVRYGYRQSGYRSEFYYVQIRDGPEFVPIYEESERHDQGIADFVDEWVAEGKLTSDEARWAKDQFE